nr:putative Gag-polypeptide of LTR copia-type [Tanacetum cinerariifolium]
MAQSPIIIPDPPENPNPVSVHPMVTRYRVRTNRPTQRLNLHVSSILPLPKSYSDAFNDPISKMLCAHLVANGSIQLEGVDVDETFSLVGKQGTIQTVLSLAASRHWLVHQLDVKNQPIEKLPMDKGQASDSEGSNIDQYDPLSLHSNETREVSLINFKLEDKTYSKQDAFVIFNMHFKIHSLSLSGSSLSKYYHKFNALWRQYDSLVNLPDCICENSKKLKKHNQFLKLMQFLMGLDEVYALIRCIILTTDTITDVKGAFATFSRDESHRSTQSHNVSKSGNGNTAFVAITNPRNNNCSSSNNHSRNLNRPNLVCTHCNMNGHTIDICFELVGYPPIFKRNTSNNKGSASNNVVLGIKDQSAGSSNSFTDNQYKRLMALISEKSSSSSMPANIADISYVINFCSSRDEEGHPDDNISAKADCDNLESAIPDENDNEFEAEFGMLTCRPCSTPTETKESTVKPKKIAANPVFHEKTNYFEIELFFLREKVSAGVIKSVKVKSVDNVADVFTKRFECSRSQ